MREGNEVIGIDAEIAQKIADKLGVELVVEDMEFDSLIAALQSGKLILLLPALPLSLIDRKRYCYRYLFQSCSGSLGSGR